MSCSDKLRENTVEPEVFQDMQSTFHLLVDPAEYADSMRLTFPKITRPLASSDFESFVRSHVGRDKIVTLEKLGSHEWHVKVSCKEVREALIRQEHVKISGRACRITPFNRTEIRGHIRYIPSSHHDDELKGILRQHGRLLLYEELVHASPCGHVVNTGVRYFALMLRQGSDASDIPHFLQVGDFKGLIVVKGRKSLCFHCRGVGHFKADCKAYREKLSDYCMREPDSAPPRSKPRGQRFKADSGKAKGAKGKGIGALVTRTLSSKQEVAESDALEASVEAAVTIEAGVSGQKGEEACDSKGTESMEAPKLKGADATNADSDKTQNVNVESCNS